MSPSPKSRKSLNFPSYLANILKYLVILSVVQDCTVLYSAEYQYPYEYSDFFKLGATAADRGVGRWIIHNTLYPRIFLCPGFFWLHTYFLFTGPTRGTWAWAGHRAPQRQPPWHPQGRNLDQAQAKRGAQRITAPSTSPSNARQGDQTIVTKY